MIGPTEQIVPLSHVPPLVPRLRRGRKIHVSTLFRWTTRGCRGVILESIQVGGTRCTSVEALQRFYEGLTQSSGCSSTPRICRPPSHRRRESIAAAKELEALGI
jgi:hypothetical protein